ncbi:katanin p80 WD40 repeat-containing subunit B1 [Trichonephila clavata]|uniref:Katanin p80 WD40 repeat-containing subunit B1 n=1 Tax=Trichonephila clavata TaxID=2740835 RepID=A0A8X6FXI4_TRICU|nr:katanin p80 WD40 repeat-containing subunit B1 [Trichonephila clavata]
MSLSSKKHWKLQEFVAHSANVNCLAFGHKSGRVLVTGGDDKNVNLWAVGKPNCIMVCNLEMQFLMLLDFEDIN